MPKIASVIAGVLAGLAALADEPATQSAPAPAGPPATKTAPATASAPAERVVKWHETYDPAAAEAARRKRLLLVLYFDPAVPACDAFEEMTLSKRATQVFLAEFAACRLNVKDAEKKKRFAETGVKQTPLTQVLTPEGELLDAMAGCIIPAARFRGQLQRSLDYRAAATTRPFDAGARWRAVQARLGLSTCARAAADVDALLKLPVGKLPEGVTPARLHVARGMAARLMSPEDARKDFEKAMEMAPKDAGIAGRALIGMADMEWGLNRTGDAYKQYSRYLKEFPKGPDVGTAFVRKAMLEFGARKDAPAAIQTLEQFIRDYPDDPNVVRAKGLLESLRKLKEPIRPGKKGRT